MMATIMFSRAYIDVDVKQMFEELVIASLLKVETSKMRQLLVNIIVSSNNLIWPRIKSPKWQKATKGLTGNLNSGIHFEIFHIHEH